MNKQSRILLASLIFMLASAACALPFLSDTGQPTASPTPGVTQAPTEAAPSLTLPTAPGGVATAEPEATVQPAPVDLSGVILNQSDLPIGFQVLDAESQKQLSVTPDEISNLFQGSFSKAKPANYFAFLNASTDTYQFVLGTLFTPLTPEESTAFDNQLGDPAKATQSFGSGMGGNAMVLSGADRLGQRSLGFTFTVDAQTMTLRGDMVLARRGDVVFLLLSMYQDGTKPTADILTLAALLDQRLKSVLIP